MAVAARAEAPPARTIPVDRPSGARHRAGCRIWVPADLGTVSLRNLSLHHGMPPAHPQVGICLTSGPAASSTVSPGHRPPRKVCRSPQPTTAFLRHQNTIPAHFWLRDVPAQEHAHHLPVERVPGRATLSLPQHPRPQDDPQPRAMGRTREPPASEAAQTCSGRHGDHQSSRGGGMHNRFQHTNPFPLPLPPPSSFPPPCSIPHPTAWLRPRGVLLPCPGHQPHGRSHAAT